MTNKQSDVFLNSSSKSFQILPRQYSILRGGPSSKEEGGDEEKEGGEEEKEGGEEEEKGKAPGWIW